MRCLEHRHAHHGGPRHCDPQPRNRRLFSPKVLGGQGHALAALVAIGLMAGCGRSSSAAGASAPAPGSVITSALPSPPHRLTEPPMQHPPTIRSTPASGEKLVFSLSSNAFEADGPIPRKYTCQGADVSPPLDWEDAPTGTKSFALIVDDPDAPDPRMPKTVWVHWVVYNLPATTERLAENASKALPPPAKHGKNDWGKPAWGGPCPPIGEHRYFHKLYALDTKLDDLGMPTKAQLLLAMKGHVLAQTQLVGTYIKH